MRDLLKTLICSILPLTGISLAGINLSAQAVQDGTKPAQQNALKGQSISSGELPLRRLSLFSSGVGFFEHTGTITGTLDLSLPFNIKAVNDALKSLVINDPDSSPSVSYPSEQTLPRTLKSLSIDLLGNPGIAELLDSLKGAEIEVLIPNPVSGRIILVEYRSLSQGEEGQLKGEPYLSLYTPQGIRVIPLKEIGSFAFKDPRINGDLNRALDLIMQSRNSDTRNLTIQLPGKTQREVSLSYVIPTPIWKVSYRLDLSQKQPFLQGWAIVDNDGDTDWEQLELSLVTGRPVSFIQNLYVPYHLDRPMLPLAIAGVAEARTYESGSSPEAIGWYTMRDDLADELMEQAEAPLMEANKESAPRLSRSSIASIAGVARGGVETAQSRAAGDQFEFTIKKPVTLARQQSAMLPLVEEAVEVEKVLVFSGVKALRGGVLNPAISAELRNTTGMKLPAGPITVYDGGTYAGDALIAFFPEGEKRLISYGEDLSVTGSANASLNRSITRVTIRQGVMTINRKQIYEKGYAFRNASGESKRLILEHPITPGTSLIEPASFTEKTDTLYRFMLTLPQRGELNYSVKEEQPLSEGIILSQLALASFVSYASNQEISPEVRAALQRAIALKRTADEAKQVLTVKENQRKRLITEQDRTRRNLEAAGNQTQQGQEYLKRLTAQDGEIDALDLEIGAAEKALKDAQDTYDAYLGELTLE